MTTVSAGPVTGTVARRRSMVRGLCVPGPDHFVTGREGQDAWRQASCDGVTVIAVADGAGSRARAADGATLAVGIAVDAVRASLAQQPRDTAEQWTDLLGRAFLQTRATLATAAHALGCTLEDMACTLTLCVVSEEWCAGGRVGDGFVAMRVGEPGDHAPEFGLLLPPPPPSERPGATCFLSTPGLEARLTSACDDLRDHVALVTVPRGAINAIVVGTDGITGAAVQFAESGAEAYAGFLEPVVEAVEDLRGYTLVDVLASGLSHVGGDDKTIVVGLFPLSETDGPRHD